MKSNELSFVISQIVSKGICCDKVWGIPIFSSCTPICGIYRKSLLSDILEPYSPLRSLRSASKLLLNSPSFNLRTYGYKSFSVYIRIKSSVRAWQKSFPELPDWGDCFANIYKSTKDNLLIYFFAIAMY